MTLSAYATARPLHDLGPTPRAEAHGVPLEGLHGATLANATRYAQQAALASYNALMAGDSVAARAHLHRAQRWEGYAATLAQHPA